MKYSYQTTGTCSKIIELEIEDGILNDVRFTGGCHGNLQGISALVKGMPVKEVIQRLEGIRCKDKPTSCPDQLAEALKSTLIAE
ncbi:MAG: TIGR03905 family TSCPD domain-containing protein [Bacteroides sp.]|nr:TIGR03905 family TSCPD domain-containing protein [Bacteroides sp.]